MLEAFPPRAARQGDGFWGLGIVVARCSARARAAGSPTTTAGAGSSTSTSRSGIAVARDDQAVHLRSRPTSAGPPGGWITGASACWRSASAPADRAGQGPGGGLVRLALDRGARDRLGRGARCFPGPRAAHSEHPIVHLRVFKDPDLRRGRVHDDGGGLRALRQPGAAADLPADAARLPGDAGRDRDGSARAWVPFSPCRSWACSWCAFDPRKLLVLRAGWAAR